MLKNSDIQSPADSVAFEAQWRDYSMSVRELSSLHGVSETRIRKWAKDLGLPRRQSGPLCRENHGMWKGGKTTDKAGYILLHMPDHPDANCAGYVREHRYVMEQHLGRRLTKQEVVHHIDDDVSNNDISNLELFENNASHLAGTLKRKCPKWTEDGKRRIREATVFVFPESVDIVSLYVDQHMSPRAIGKIVGCSEEPVKNQLRKAGVQLRSNSQAHLQFSYPPLDVLREKRETMTVAEIAREYGVPKSGLQAHCVRNGIRNGMKLEHVSNDEVSKMYLELKMSTKDIGKHFGCSGSCISKRLKSMGISIRPLSESKLEYKYPSPAAVAELWKTHTVPQMSKLLEIPHSALMGYIRKHGLVSPFGTGPRRKPVSLDSATPSESTPTSRLDQQPCDQE